MTATEDLAGRVDFDGFDFSNGWLRFGASGGGVGGRATDGGAPGVRLDLRGTFTMATQRFVTFLVTGSVLCSFPCFVGGQSGDTVFLRGDTNADGRVSVADAYFLARYLCCGGETPDCLDTADVNDDALLDLADFTQLFSHGVFGETPPAVPFPELGPDPTVDGLECPAYEGSPRPEDPDATLYLSYLSATDGVAKITVRLASDADVVGYSGRVRDEDGVLAEASTEGELHGVPPIKARDLSGSTLGATFGARVREGYLNFGYHADFYEPQRIEPGFSRGVLELQTPVRPDAPPGEHPLTLEEGELIDEAGRSVAPVLDADPLWIRGREPFLRGDCNEDGFIDISDGLCVIWFLFLGGPFLACPDASDTNDDGIVNISDIIYPLNWLFLGGAAPPEPGPFQCGVDPTPDGLPCPTYPWCG